MDCWKIYLNPNCVFEWQEYKLHNTMGRVCDFKTSCISTRLRKSNPGRLGDTKERWNTNDLLIKGISEKKRGHRLSSLVFTILADQRCEFIKENKKTRTRPRKRSRKHEKRKKTRSRPRKRSRKKEKAFFIVFLVEGVFSFFLTFLLSFINSRLWSSKTISLSYWR